MKTKILSILLVLTVFTAFGGAFLEFFTAKSEDSHVKIEWRTGDESNVRDFVLERKVVKGSYMPIASMKAKGSNSSYSFLDEGAYKSSDVLYIYRLKIIDKDNTQAYSKEISVNHAVSGVKKTWGSIKAMFR